MDTIVPQRLWYIYMGEYQLRSAHFYLPLLIFSVLVITREQNNDFRFINMNNCHSIFLPFSRLCISLLNIAFDIYFMGEYQLRCAHLYSPLLFFSVLVIIKYQKNGSSSINIKNYHSIFLPFLDFEYHCPIKPLIYFYW